MTPKKPPTEPAAHRAAAQDPGGTPAKTSAHAPTSIASVQTDQGRFAPPASKFSFGGASKDQAPGTGGISAEPTQRAGPPLGAAAHRDLPAKPARIVPPVEHPSTVTPNSRWRPATGPSAPRSGEAHVRYGNGHPYRYRVNRNFHDSRKSSHYARDVDRYPPRHADLYRDHYSSHDPRGSLDRNPNRRDNQESHKKTARRNHEELNAFPERVQVKAFSTESKVKLEDKEFEYELVSVPSVQPEHLQAPMPENARDHRALTRRADMLDNSNDKDIIAEKYCSRCADNHEEQACKATQCSRCHCYHATSVSCFVAAEHRVRRDAAMKATDFHELSIPMAGQILTTGKHCKKCALIHRDHGPKTCKSPLCPRCSLHHFAEIPCSGARMMREEAVVVARASQPWKRKPKKQKKKHKKSDSENKEAETTQLSQSAHVDDVTTNSITTGKTSDARYNHCRNAEEETASQPRPEPRPVPRPEHHPESQAEPRTGSQVQTSHQASLVSEAMKVLYDRDGPEGIYKFLDHLNGSEKHQLAIRPAMSNHHETVAAATSAEQSVNQQPRTKSLSKRQEGVEDQPDDWSSDYTSDYQSDDQEELKHHSTEASSRKLKHDQRDVEQQNSKDQARANKRHRNDRNKLKSQKKGPKQTKKRTAQNFEGEKDTENHKSLQKGRVSRMSIAATTKGNKRQDFDDDDCEPGTPAKARKRRRASDAQAQRQESDHDVSDAPPKSKKHKRSSSNGRVNAPPKTKKRRRQAEPEPEPQLKSAKKSKANIKKEEETEPKSESGSKSATTKKIEPIKKQKSSRSKKQK